MPYTKKPATGRTAVGKKRGTKTATKKKAAADKRRKSLSPFGLKSLTAAEKKKLSAGRGPRAGKVKGS